MFSLLGSQKSLPLHSPSAPPDVHFESRNRYAESHVWSSKHEARQALEAHFRVRFQLANVLAGQAVTRLSAGAVGETGVVQQS